MARPKKKIDNNMTYISESLEEIEHVSDRYYELLNILASMERHKNPVEYDRIEAESEEEWDRSSESPFTEADWISKCARYYARRMLKAFKSNSDVKIEYEDVAQNAMLAILSAGKYDYMLPKKKKAAYIKSMVRGRFIDYTRSQKKYNERYRDQPYEDDPNTIKKKAG